MKLYCATGNQGKLREFRLAGHLLGIEVLPVEGLKDIPAPEETGATFEENARLKAAYYSRFAPGMLFADDSGLEVDALDGAPGVYSARYAGPNANDADNNQLLLRNLTGIANRTARFVCAIAVAEADEARHIFRGTVEGEILDAPRGPAGFGYDPLFYYPDFACSFGEADDNQKFSVSHRGKALRNMLAYLAGSS